MESLRRYGSGFLLQSSYVFMVSEELNDMIGFETSARASDAGVKWTGMSHEDRGRRGMYFGR